MSQLEVALIFDILSFLGEKFNTFTCKIHYESASKTLSDFLYIIVMGNTYSYFLTVETIVSPNHGV